MSKQEKNVCFEILTTTFLKMIHPSNSIQKEKRNKIINKFWSNLIQQGTKCHCHITLIKPVEG